MWQTVAAAGIRRSIRSVPWAQVLRGTTNSGQLLASSRRSIRGRSVRIHRLIRSDNARVAARNVVDPVDDSQLTVGSDHIIVARVGAEDTLVEHLSLERD